MSPAKCAATGGLAFGSRLKPGARVAIGVGSRGISDIATIVRAAVDYWKAARHAPVHFPAMGSHGAATAEGQADVLAHYGVTRGPWDAHRQPVGGGVAGQDGRRHRSLHGSRRLRSDGVMLINRVKWHTDFSGKIESGLFKMMAIGLGKFAGAGVTTRTATSWDWNMSSAAWAARC